ncbi:preprotein translocase subunit SecG [uncultured Megasphaera sp.]|uniref:preprotein translocase subunit SecG n=1 Tax=uncultured Megasphaera sp. TaxID=165188 RepID=UPI00265B0BD3|nr:preprotein translocase subunit SecG [uncultured Megasphaera sp.]
MITVLEILVFILSLLLIGVVVAQKSKTQGMGAGFGGGADDLFGSRARGMDALLSKLTIVLSIAFAVCTLLLGRLMHTF